MGEISIGNIGDTLVTLLGSCVAVILHDVIRQKAGLAHVQLPYATSIRNVETSDGPANAIGKYADQAIPEMIRLIRSDTPRKYKLVAHLVGGADMFVSQRTTTIGQSNLLAVREILTDLNIPIASSDCGGNQARRLNFVIKTGDLQIQFVTNPQRLARLNGQSAIDSLGDM